MSPVRHADAVRSASPVGPASPGHPASPGAEPNAPLGEPASEVGDGNGGSPKAGEPAGVETPRTLPGGVGLEARDLHFRHPGSTSGVEGISLQAGVGARVALLGRNGAGKTTLLHLLGGALAPERGSVHWGDLSLPGGREARDAWRRAVGLVLQDPDDMLFAPTVEEDLAFGPTNLALPAGEIRARVQEAIGGFGLEAVRGRPVHALSHGQKKRVALAGILAMRPSFLLLDEPMAGLDPEGRRSFLALLERESQRGATLLLSTHDVSFAAGWATRVIFLDAGRVVASGDPASLLVDSPRLQRLGLEPPAALQLGEAAVAAGWISADEPLPLTTEGLVARMRRQG